MYYIVFVMSTAIMFSLHLSWQDLEAEVNIHHKELCVVDGGETADTSRSCDQLLTNQLQRLAMCLDIYLESESGDVDKEKMYYRPCR